jgi:hypothetical protein
MTMKNKVGRKEDYHCGAVLIEGYLQFERVFFLSKKTISVSACYSLINWQRHDE